ncbi:translation initiation factor IF-2 [Streptomyces sp. NPDC058442]|uniref:translation initiation factor IF-2 n=1 Tax=Streptomyces sp. NPDC058442 TaxID=3346503 RepID=UPI00365436B0
MAGGKPGGGTSFEDMSHEQMLAWLDQANAGTVQAAADRLVAAAEEIRKIAEELKVRPQWVEWKGKGADAFRTWSGDLANSTLRLGDFSEDAAKWLAETSGAIAQAQVAIPRDAESAQANLDAARAARNDPDAAAVGAKSASELEALAANKEKVRQQAAAQMRKLGQTYTWSATQLNALERPKFPPPPKAFVPTDSRSIGYDPTESRPGSSVTGTTISGTVSSAYLAQGREGSASAPDLRQSQSPGAASAAHHTPVDVKQPTQMAVDSVATLPQSSPSPTAAAGSQPGPESVKGGVAPQSGITPPVFGSRAGAPVNSPAGHGRAPGMGRMPFQPGQGPTLNPVRMPSGAGAAGSSNGIVGGRSVMQPEGRPTGAIPRGTVVGGDRAVTHGPVGPTAGTASPAGRVVGQQSQVPARRSQFSNGGVVGGRPLPNAGAGSGRPQQPGRTGAVVSGPGSPSAVGSSGSADHGIVGGVSSAARSGQSHGVGGARAPQPASPRSPGGRNGRPRRAAEDEETRRQDDRRTVPPVIN